MIQFFRKVTVIGLVFMVCSPALSQSGLDSLKAEILSVKADVENIHLNLGKSKSKFQRGIFVATLGYTITIAGGLMLGRDNDDLGQALLVAGGVTGATGTYLLVDAFKYLGRTRKRTPK
ncbi:hypothetical protein FNH22_12150 [Fulvivirga sp. M361]|uniref:hypothetical protein n=1 Tax=Fulvivirga sp. M361 TaxID=2594266 RepID=UPI001179F3C8|nr:hypothetical protein [Fulvivirga sp. M361]TRX58626.1 hypothetical protein FNH22_12150 [Fulvivirga sp. M361]